MFKKNSRLIIGGAKKGVLPPILIIGARARAAPQSLRLWLVPFVAFCQQCFLPIKRKYNTIQCIIFCPGHGSDGGPGGRDCHGEKKRLVQRSLKHARLRSSSYGDLRSNQRHWPELSARSRSQADHVNRRQPRDLFLATTLLYHHTTL